MKTTFTTSDGYTFVKHTNEAGFAYWSAGDFIIADNPALGIPAFADACNSGVMTHTEWFTVYSSLPDVFPTYSLPVQRKALWDCDGFTLLDWEAPEGTPGSLAGQIHWMLMNDEHKLSHYDFEVMRVTSLRD